MQAISNNHLHSQKVAYESNFERLGPAITPTKAKRAKDATPTIVAERLPLPIEKVANEITAMKILKLENEKIIRNDSSNDSN